MYFLVEHILKTVSGSDLGFYNEGGVRNLLHEGEITARHIWNIHPFGNRLATVRILGKDISGELARRLKFLGTPIDPDHLYSVATNAFVVEPTRREALMGITESTDVADILIRDMAIDYIKAGGALDALFLPIEADGG